MNLVISFYLYAKFPLFNTKKMENYPKEIAIRLFSHVAKYWIQYVGDNVESFRKFECLTSVIPDEPDYWGIIDDDNVEKLLALYQNMCDFYIADQMIWGIQNDPELVKLLEPYGISQIPKQNKSNTDFGFEIEKDFSPFTSYVLKNFIVSINNSKTKTSSSFMGRCCENGSTSSIQTVKRRTKNKKTGTFLSH